MPGIFVSYAHQEEDQKASSEKKWNKKNLFFLIGPIIFFFLLFCNRGDTELLDLPTKHVDFIGREKELGILKKHLHTKKKERGSNLVALCGESGIGKTELAIAFANNRIKDFSLISWIDGSSEETISYSYAKLGEFLGIQESHFDTLWKKVHGALEKQRKKPWLLIFDDLREVPFDLPKSGGMVLVTCRDKSICPPKTLLEIEKNPLEAIHLLSKLTGEKELESLNQIAKQLDHLPLMMNLIGHYIAETPGVSISNFSAIAPSLLASKDSLLQKVDFIKRYARSLAETYLTTLEILKEKEPICVEFLKQAIYLHPNHIPVEYLSCWLKAKEKYSATQELCLRGDTLRELQNHCLI
ncbi:MAG: hypothetical protein K1000chlam2_00630 [Chlamydiae bacterium]|nr:hypothetical protein [Chlamydiota bacterium]